MATATLGALIPTWAGAKLLPQCFSPPSRSKDRLPALPTQKISNSPVEPTPDLAAAAAAGSVGIQGGEQRASHMATVPRPQRGHRGSSAEALWRFLGKHLSAFPAELPSAGPRHPPGLLQAMGDLGGMRMGKSRAVTSPYPRTIPVPTFTWLTVVGRSTLLHQLFSWKKNPLSFREPSGEDGPSSLSPVPCPSGPDPGQVHAVAVAWDPLAPAAASSGPRQQQSGSHVCGRMERPWGDPSGGLGWAKWVLVLPRATHTCKDRGLTPPVASCPRATSPTGSNPHG